MEVAGTNLNLPDDLLRLILESIDLKTTLRLSLTTKLARWRCIGFIPKLACLDMHNVQIHAPEAVLSVFGLVANSGSMRTVDLRLPWQWAQLSNTDFGKVTLQYLEKFTSLRRLESHFGLPIPRLLAVISRRLTHLTSLDLSGCHAGSDWVTESLAQLTHLRLLELNLSRLNTSCDDAEPPPIAVGGPQGNNNPAPGNNNGNGAPLAAAQRVGNKRITWPATIANFTALRSLKIASLRGRGDVAQHFLTHLTRLPDLTELDISFCFTAQSALKSLTFLTNLRSLTLASDNGSEFGFLDTLRLVSKSLFELRTLRMSRHWQGFYKFDEIQSLTRCEALQELSLVGFGPDKAESWVSMVKELKRLRCLVTSPHPDCPPPGLGPLLHSHFPELSVRLVNTPTSREEFY